DMRTEVLQDYRIGWVSREASILARKEVLTGKAKFGIIGDGKELPQIALSKFFQPGDWRSGYYRDQTIMFALGIASLKAFFAQLYADTENDPFSGGRQMNSHYATPNNEDGSFIALTDQYNTSSDISPTAGQMARGLGLAFASKKFRENPALHEQEHLSKNGNEVCFVTIGDASTSEGVFWETMNAAGVLQVPMAVSVWDDGYGISVPIDYQTTKKSISKALAGLDATPEEPGVKIFTVKAWDYLALCKTYQEAIAYSRQQHSPVLIHVEEVTQPQGHSTSGSHERYKSKERLQWEREHDCLVKFKEWILAEGIATAEELDQINQEAKKEVREAQKSAWKDYTEQVKPHLHHLRTQLEALAPDPTFSTAAQASLQELKTTVNPTYSEILAIGQAFTFQFPGVEHPALGEIRSWITASASLAEDRYHNNLYSHSSKAATQVPAIAPEYSENSPSKNGYEILQQFFDLSLERYPTLFAFGEDVGKIGDVNQGFAGLQEKYGEHRVFDTGIREWTIVGQAIGMALRGLRPIAEIQYLDYLIYGLEPLSDDLATLRYRTDGLQIAPAIIRTRGHRLEGIWHAGSPLGMMLHSLRGIHICVPRNMVQAAGFYNTLLQSDEPAIVVECLNGYRLKEKQPDNLATFTIPLGVPEVLSEGTDLTLVTYGSCVRVAQKALPVLDHLGISVELIDVQTLLPFDLEFRIVESLKKTNRILFLDEDVPGGATAYMMQEVLEKQDGYQFLDSAPQTLSAKAHRPPYGSDGDYFTKPNRDSLVRKIYQIMREVDPQKYLPL
ncbi:MAG: thiamine pyrophosphate-dependent enzyme, partial [Bacteroidota bacterium]